MCLFGLFILTAIFTCYCDIQHARAINAIEQNKLKYTSTEDKNKDLGATSFAEVKGIPSDYQEMKGNHSSLDEISKDMEQKDLERKQVQDPNGASMVVPLAKLEGFIDIYKTLDIQHFDREGGANIRPEQPPDVEKIGPFRKKRGNPKKGQVEEKNEAEVQQTSLNMGQNPHESKKEASRKSRRKKKDEAASEKNITEPQEEQGIVTYLLVNFFLKYNRNLT